jgi:hypothetical protein
VGNGKQHRQWATVWAMGNTFEQILFCQTFEGNGQLLPGNTFHTRAMGNSEGNEQHFYQKLIAFTYCKLHNKKDNYIKIDVSRAVQTIFYDLF